MATTIASGSTSTNDQAKIEWTRKNVKTVPRTTIYEKIRKWQAENPDKYITNVKDHNGKLMLGASGQGLTAEEFIAHVESENAHGHMVTAPRAGTYGGKYEFMPDGKVASEVTINTTPEQEAQAVQKLEDEKKGGIWEWLKKYGGWILAGAAALGVALYFMLRKKSTKTVYVQDPDKDPVMPTPDGNGGNGGNDNPGNSGNGDLGNGFPGGSGGSGNTGSENAENHPNSSTGPNGTLGSNSGHPANDGASSESSGNNNANLGSFVDDSSLNNGNITTGRNKTY